MTLLCLKHELAYTLGKLKMHPSHAIFLDYGKSVENLESPFSDYIHGSEIRNLAYLVAKECGAQLWGGLLHVSRGALELPKCNYYVIQWRFQLSSIPTVETNLNTMLQIENGDQTAIITLKNDAITIAQKTLGP
jgi:hypothetical protein